MLSRAVWNFLTSLKLTIVLLVISIFIVFFGTLAQVNLGLYQATTMWFWGWFIWWGPKGLPFQIPVFPGGYLVGTLLLANLLAAHIKRFTWGLRKLGIHLTHFGIILLLVGGLATKKLSQESLMSMHQGEKLSYSEDHRENELVVLSDAGNGQDKVVSFPDSMVAKRKDLTQEDLPFTVHVEAFHPNAQIMSRKSVLEVAGQLTTAIATMEAEYSAPAALAAQAELSAKTPGRVEVWKDALKAIGETDTSDIVSAAKRIATDPNKGPKLCTELRSQFKSQMLARFKNPPPMIPQGPARHYAAVRIEKNEPVTDESLPSATPTGAGKGLVLEPLEEVKTLDERNMPAAIVSIEAQGKKAGEFVLWPFLEPQEFDVAGKTYRTALRFTRYYHPFSLTLLKMTHDIYPGTDIPKNFQSQVRVDNAETGEHRNVDIYMNNPLRYAGMTFYQYQMSPAELAQSEQTSTLQVVHNPSWLTPYFGCALVALGMIYQFLFHLVAFVTKRRAPAARPEKAKSKRTPAHLATAVASSKD